MHEPRPRPRVDAVIWSRLSADEQNFVREAAVMAFWQGILHPGERPPADSAVVSLVLDACTYHQDLYPHLTGLGERITPAREHEVLARAVSRAHPARCRRCGSFGRDCDCAAGWACGTCAADGPVPWPCVTLQALGQVAVCGGLLEQLDGSASECGGVVFYRPRDVEARCVECGAYCGRDVATYVSEAT